MAPRSAPFSSFGRTAILLPRLAYPGGQGGLAVGTVGQIKVQPLPTRVTVASLPRPSPASSATSAFEDASVHSDEAPAAIDPFSASLPPGAFADGSLAIRPRYFATVRGRCSVFLCTA
ncbi:hypothetical protein G6L37_19475 [Agrobacterium rubi]|uniref:hypothetical protein n=1 Tax=Agrobacterium rubi TaxID=28099 RepID=UPI0015732489|nr:hypothetical protein [Agrobacterium rubi]NTF08352.1 hypothetical protein [Agrobacterium rubi]NTF20580.1 hypothetical protein [Agrobacterium rubi]